MTSTFPRLSRPSRPFLGGCHVVVSGIKSPKLTNKACIYCGNYQEVLYLHVLSVQIKVSARDILKLQITR